MTDQHRYGIESLAYSHNDDIERRMWFIVDLADGHNVPDPESPGLVLGYDSEKEARAKCADLNRLTTIASTRLASS